MSNSTQGHLNNLGSSRAPKFKAIGLLVLEKKICFKVLPYMGMAAILVICDPTHLYKFTISMLPSAFKCNLFSNDQTVPEKNTS